MKIQSKPSVTNALGTFTMTRSDLPRQFTCATCPEYKTEKTAKNMALWQRSSGDEVNICNQCHGELLAQARRGV